VESGARRDAAGTGTRSCRLCQQSTKACCEADISILETSTGTRTLNFPKICKMDILNLLLIDQRSSFLPSSSIGYHRRESQNPRSPNYLWVTGIQKSKIESTLIFKGQRYKIFTSNVVRIFLYPSLAAIQSLSKKISPQLQAACQISMLGTSFQDSC